MKPSGSFSIKKYKLNYNPYGTAAVYYLVWAKSLHFDKSQKITIAFNYE